MKMRQSNSLEEKHPDKAKVTAKVVKVVKGIGNEKERIRFEEIDPQESRSYKTPLKSQRIIKNVISLAKIS